VRIGMSLRRRILPELRLVLELLYLRLGSSKLGLIRAGYLYGIRVYM